MSLQMKRTFDEEKNQWIVDLQGEIDIYTASELKEFFIKIVDERMEDIKINGEMLEYIDSTGLGILIGVLKRLKKEDKNIIISNIKANVKKLLNITGLDKIFIIEG